MRPVISMVLPFEVAVDTALRKIAGAKGRHALDIAEAQGVGTVYGYYLAGAVPPVTYRAARDRLMAEAEQHRGIAAIRDALEERDRTEVGA
jgi:hypothetical protein